jgi:hypothetical protein
MQKLKEITLSKVSRIIILLFLFNLCNCSGNKARNQMLIKLQGVYCLDKTTTNKIIVEYLNCDSIKLLLKSDYTYEFQPRQNKLIPFEGKWSLSNDIEVSNWIFETNSGLSQKNRFLGINLGSRNNVLDSQIMFTKCK